ncbi:GTA-gp10 family protein [Methylosinus sp. LW4]|uniref:GTA-gp10 family protein n=1 Tax=Methylosinus sp. LW4 TaxID=136993 RepID=UPI000367265D|nr:GTA-gp10 family protein [Methylosinus sp. LW4]
MANKVRGAVSLQLGEETLNICLGLGALAEIEDAFEVDSFEQAPVFAGRGVSARSALKFLEAILNGNDFELTPARLAALRTLRPNEVFDLIQSLFRASGLEAAASPEAQEGAAPPLGAESAGASG